jgi:YVTN family beta-propeller protein
MFACSGWPPFPCILLDTVWRPTDEGEGEPLGAALSPDGEHLYVACNGPDSLVKIRTSDNTLEGLIPLPGYAWDVCVHPSGRYVYVSGYNHLGDWVWVVSADGDSVCAEVRLGGSGRVEPLPDGRYVYVASEDVDSVWAIETQGNTVVAWLPADGEPIELVARQDGEFVYAACCAGSIVTIRTSDNTVTDVQPSPYETMGLALSPDGTYGFVPVQEDIDCIAVRDLAGRYDVNRIALSDAVWPGRVGLLPGGDYLLSCAGVEEWPALMVVRLADSAAVAYLEFEFDWGFPAEPVDFVASASGERLYVVDWLNMLVLVLGTPGSSGSGRPVPRVTLTRPGPRPRLAAVSARRGR